MNQPEDLAERLVCLEQRLHCTARQVRVLKIVLLAMAGAAAFGLVAGADFWQEPAKEVRARRIVLEDAEGRPRIVMEMAKRPLNPGTEDRTDLCAVLRVLDPTGQDRIELSTNQGDVPDGRLAILRMFTRDGKRRMDVVTGKRGYLAFFDEDGSQVIETLPKR